VPLSARKGRVIVRAGKGGDFREIPLLDPSARAAVAGWKTGRVSWPAPKCGRCSTAAAGG
jgi:integrase/recombinase XerC